MKSLLLLSLLITSTAFAAPKIRCSITQLSGDIMGGRGLEDSELELKHESEGSKLFAGSVSVTDSSGAECKAVAELEKHPDQENYHFIEATFTIPGAASFSSGGHHTTSAMVRSNQDRKTCSCWFTEQ